MTLRDWFNPKLWWLRFWHTSGRNHLFGVQCGFMYAHCVTCHLEYWTYAFDMCQQWTDEKVIDMKTGEVLA